MTNMPRHDRSEPGTQVILRRRHRLFVRSAERTAGSSGQIRAAVLAAVLTGVFALVGTLIGLGVTLAIANRSFDTQIAIVRDALQEDQASQLRENRRMAYKAWIKNARLTRHSADQHSECLWLHPENEAACKSERIDTQLIQLEEVSDNVYFYGSEDAVAIVPIFHEMMLEFRDQALDPAGAEAENYRDGLQDLIDQMLNIACLEVNAIPRPSC